MKHYKKSKRIRRRKNKTKRGGTFKEPTFNPIRMNELRESMYEMTPSFLVNFIKHSDNYLMNRGIRTVFFNKKNTNEDINEQKRMAEELLKNKNYLEHHKVN